MPASQPKPDHSLARWFEAATLQRGRSYFNKGAVLDYEVNGNHIKGRVRGSYEDSYDTRVTTSWRGGALSNVDATCSCPVGYQCKHGVTLALVLLAERDQDSGLSPLIKRWYQQLEATSEKASIEKDQQDNIIYVLSLKEKLSETALHCGVYAARKLKSGGLSKQTRQISLLYDKEEIANPVDQKISGLLRHAVNQYSRLIDADKATDLIKELVATDRCYWGTSKGEKIRLGPSIAAEFVWQTADDEHMELNYRVPDGEGLTLLPTQPIWYHDTDSNCVGPLQFNCPDELIPALLSAPRIPKDAAAQVTEQLLERTHGSVPTPVPVTPAANADQPPKVRLRVGNQLEQIGANLQFVYGSNKTTAVCDFAYNRDQVIVQWGDDWLSYPRQRGFERRCAEQLLAAGLSQPVANLPQHFTHQNMDSWLDFQHSQLPEFEAQGWEVVYDEGYSAPTIINSDDWYAQSEDDDSGWFSTELGIEVDGVRHNLLPILVGWLRRLPPGTQLDSLIQADSPPAWLELEDSRWLKLPLARLAPIFDTLLELYDDKPLTADGQLKLPTIRAHELVDLQAQSDNLHWEVSVSLSEKGQRLKEFEGLQDVELPKGLNATLRRYQHDGINWLDFLREFEFGGVLADDMGLGKTVQTLTQLLLEKERGHAEHPSIVVAPTSLLSNWRNEARDFTPDLKVVVLHGPRREELREEALTADIIVTSYPLMVRDSEWYLEYEWHYLVLDEAQTIKNHRTKAAKLLRDVQANHRLCLTGTPMENHLGELWSLMHFLIPGLLGDQTSFKRLFRTPIETHADEARRDSLARRVKPFLLRRTKQAVASDLPPKTEILRSVPLEGKQRDLYETLRVALDKELRKEIENRGIGRSQIAVLDALLKLRQVCCDPRLVKVQAAAGVRESAKLELLMTLLPELLQEGRSILLFSQFTSMLELIEAELKANDMRYVKLTGQTKDRATPIEQFQAGHVPIFLISLKAGGTGLNLTQADTVIHYDPWWNPAVENQATDRAHRIGQDKPVFVYKLLTENTIEDRIQDLQKRKRALYDAVLAGGTGQKASIGADDLATLFEPLDVE